jgi:hypothetical protein
VCHISTFVPSNRLSISDAWPLHLGAILVFGAMVVILARNQKSKRPLRNPGESYFEWWGNAKNSNREYMAEIVHSIPLRLRILCVAIFIYNLVNFALFIKNSQGGGPSVENGKYYLTSHGHIIRELSEQEFYYFRAHELRGFSGHWILFSLVPAVYFSTVRKARASAESIPKAGQIK